jgi:hypothetical protein
MKEEEDAAKEAFDGTAFAQFSRKKSGKPGLMAASGA